MIDAGELSTECAFVIANNFRNYRDDTSKLGVLRFKDYKAVIEQLPGADQALIRCQVTTLDKQELARLKERVKNNPAAQASFLKRAKQIGGKNWRQELFKLSHRRLTEEAT